MIGGSFYAARSPSGKPFQRPPRAAKFTDREQDLAHLIAQLELGRAVTLWGPGGMGKTALAAEAIWQMMPGKEPSAQFPDGVIFYSFYGRPEPALAFEHLVRSYDETAQDTSAEAAYRLLSGKQALVVLDGTEDAQDLPVVLDTVSGCGVLVTSRRRQDAVEDRQEITPLPSDEAQKLLRKWGESQIDDEAAARQICNLVGGLPLAVRLVGRYLDETEEKASEYLGWLKKTPLQALDHGERRLESVDVLLARSLEQVSKAAKQVLTVTGLLALAPFDRAVIGASLPETNVPQALGELVNYGLLLRGDEHRYAVSHALIHTYARRRLTASAEASTRLIAYYTSLAKEQSPRGPEGYTRLDEERLHLMGVLAGGDEREEWQAVNDLVWALDNYLTVKGYSADRVTSLEIGVKVARNLGSRHNEGAALGNLGSAYRDLGQVDKAIDHYQQALVIAREIGFRQGEATQLGNLGVAYRNLGQVDKAIDHYQQALVIDREIGDRQGEAADLGNLGSAYRGLGDVEKAIGHHQQALVIAREIGDRQGEAAQLGNLGVAYRDLGDVEKAIGHHQQALVIAREIGDRQGEATQLGNLGTDRYLLGQKQQAIEFYEQALAITREIGDRRKEGEWLGGLGNAYRNLGQVDKAIDHYQQALVIAREIGDRQGEAADLGNLGSAYRALGQVDKAIGHHQQALVIAREIGFRQGEASVLGSLGSAYRDLGDVEKAKEQMSQALLIFEEIKSPTADLVRKWLDELKNNDE